MPTYNYKIYLEEDAISLPAHEAHYIDTDKKSVMVKSSGEEIKEYLLNKWVALDTEDWMYSFVIDEQPCIILNNTFIKDMYWNDLYDKDVVRTLIWEEYLVIKNRSDEVKLYEIIRKVKVNSIGEILSEPEVSLSQQPAIQYFLWRPNQPQLNNPESFNDGRIVGNIYEDEELSLPDIQFDDYWHHY